MQFDVKAAQKTGIQVVHAQPGGILILYIPLKIVHQVQMIVLDGPITRRKIFRLFDLHTQSLSQIRHLFR